MHSLCVGAGLEKARDVHTGVVVLPHYLILEGEHEVHGLGDGVIEGPPPPLDAGALRQLDQCRTFLVGRTVLTAEGIYRRPLNGPLLGLVPTERRLGNADAGSGLLQREPLLFTEPTQVGAELPPAGSGSNCHDSGPSCPST